MPAVLLKMNFIITLPSADSLGYRLVDPQLLSFVWNKLIANKNIIFSLSFHISTVGTITRILKNFQFKNTLSSCFHDTLPPVSYTTQLLQRPTAEGQNYALSNMVNRWTKQCLWYGPVGKRSSKGILVACSWKRRETIRKLRAVFRLDHRFLPWYHRMNISR